MSNKLSIPLIAALLASPAVNATTLEDSLLNNCGFDFNPQFLDITLGSIGSNSVAPKAILIDGVAVPPDFCNDIGITDPAEFDLMLKAMTPNQLASTTRAAKMVGQSQGKAIRNRLLNQRGALGRPNNSEPGVSSTSRLVGGAASAEALLGQGISVFGTAQTNNGDKEKTSLEESYDWSGSSLSLGGDYRLNANLIVGGALGLSSNDTAFGSARGSMESNSAVLSTYGTYYTDQFYMDWMASYGYFDYKTRRDIVFMLVDTSAAGDTAGDQWSLSLAGGTDFFIGDKTISPYLSVSYVDTTIDGYTESGAGSYNYAIDKQESTSTSSTLGIRVSQAKSYCWGIFSPSAHIEWQYEFSRDPRAISNSFEVDPTQTFNASTDLPDRSYFSLGVASSIMLPGGRAGFVSISRTIDQQYIDNTVFNIGYRAEF